MHRKLRTQAHHGLFGARPRNSRRHRRPVGKRELRLESLEPKRVLAANFVISEFMAVNNLTLADEDNEFPDWIEIHNNGDMAGSLDGYSLTDDIDDLTKWTFPDVTLGADEYLVVFASDKFRNDPAGELHTSFKLSAAGEYLGLVAPDGFTVEFAYTPKYPQQQADISFGIPDGDPGAFHFFDQPSPRSANGTGSEGVSAPPEFSATSGTFTASFMLELSAPAGATIRYTTNGRLPNVRSAIYQGPISISTSTIVIAITSQDGLLQSNPRTETFVSLSSQLQSFNSDLPVVVIENFGGGDVPADFMQPAFMAIFEQDSETGRTTLTSSPTLDTRAGIKIRGSSTLNRPKKAYGIEAWDDENQDKEISPLGFAPESDFILYAAYNFDRALIRNAFVYDLSNQVGRYAVRTRFVEVFVNTNGGAVTQADYVGVYSFMEKIKRDPTRVDIAKLDPQDTTEPDVSGGYILKIDRVDPGDTGFRVNGLGPALLYVEPKEEEIERVPEQAAWIRNYFNEFMAALNGPNFTDPEEGYAKYIDVDSWIDHHILNVLPMNVDAFRLSGYMFKDRGQKIEMGPVWDFDRTMESDDGRDNNPRMWNGTGDGTDFFGYEWWRRLFADPNFMQKWIDRWHELRQDELSTENIHATIDRMADEIRESQQRNFDQWPAVRPRNAVGGTWQAEINHMKQWLQDRVEWIDEQFPGVPTFSREGGVITPGTELQFGSSASAIYYTLDGSDPRLPGGAVNPNAIVASRPAQVSLVLNESTRVRARGRTGLGWGALADEAFVIGTPELRITEVMYHPQDPQPGSMFEEKDFEFIELENTGAETLPLGGFSLSEGVEFTFPDIDLAAGERIVVVKNEAAFRSRYGEGPTIAGVYTGSLSNAGERLVLKGSFNEPILDFVYSDAWYASTDGPGNSLTIVDSAADPNTWGEAASWRPSRTVGGSPGSVEIVTVPGDTNGDGEVDLVDLNNVRNNFGGGGMGDTNGDGVVDLEDLNNVRNNFGAMAPAPVSAPPVAAATINEDRNGSDSASLVVLDQSPATPISVEVRRGAAVEPAVEPVVETRRSTRRTSDEPTDERPDRPRPDGEEPEREHRRPTERRQRILRRLSREAVDHLLPDMRIDRALHHRLHRLHRLLRASRGHRPHEHDAPGHEAAWEEALVGVADER